jgi:hypothetical protein
MRGKGYWTNEFYRRAREIPNVSEGLIYEVGIPLQNELRVAEKTRFTRLPLKLFGILTNKEKLVNNAIENLRILTEKLNSGDMTKFKDSEGHDWLFNPLNQAFSPAAPKFAELQKVERVLDQEAQEEHITDVQPKKFEKNFPTVNLNGFDPALGHTIPWGRYNSIIVLTRRSNEAAHSAVLIRNPRTTPTSYIFYDSHGLPYTDSRSEFYERRFVLNRMTEGGENVDQNKYTHQCGDDSLCASYAVERATHPELSNEEFNTRLLNQKAKFPGITNPELIMSITKQPLGKGKGKCRKCGKLKIN